MLKAIQCFGILTMNSSQSTAVDGELKDSVTVSPMRSGIMGMFQVMCQTRESFIGTSKHQEESRNTTHSGVLLTNFNLRCLDGR